MYTREIYESWDVRVVTCSRENYQHKQLNPTEKTTSGKERPPWRPTKIATLGQLACHGQPSMMMSQDDDEEARVQRKYDIGACSTMRTMVVNGVTLMNLVASSRSRP
jgi:hypothetical protein